MRWGTEKNFPLKKRMIRKFLWFPKKIDKETRWLEKATILQLLYCPYRLPSDCYKWKDLRWIDGINEEQLCDLEIKEHNKKTFIERTELNY